MCFQIDLSSLKDKTYNIPLKRINLLWTYDMMSFQKIYSPTQLANAMKLVRQQNGWTQSELAKKIGIKQATISNFENNPDNTTLTTFFKILQSLELSMTLCDAKNASPESTEQQNLEW